MTIVLIILGVFLFIGYLGSKDPRFNKKLEEERKARRKALELKFALEASQRTQHREKCRKIVLYEIIEFMKTYQTLIKTEDFYSYKKDYAHFRYQKGLLRKKRPSEYEILVTIRFCQMEYFYETCDRKIEYFEAKQMLHWQSIEINVEEIFDRLLKHHKEYWDDVLDSYVRKDARIKRIYYLIEKANELKTLPGFSESIYVMQRIDEMIAYYNKMLSV